MTQEFKTYGHPRPIITALGSGGVLVPMTGQFAEVFK